VSDTPRTDAAAIRCACSTYVVPSEFARELERENAALRAALKCEREWVLALTKDNGLLLKAVDKTKAGALAVHLAGRIEKLEDDKATLERENAALRADKGCLDWLFTPDGGTWLYWAIENGEWAREISASRAAIEIAMKKGKL
jgi:hypothetical protein